MSSPTNQLTALFQKHTDGTITYLERYQLRDLLEERYTCGDTLPDHPCSKCGKPLILTYAHGPFCMASHGGCGCG